MPTMPNVFPDNKCPGGCPIIPCAKLCRWASTLRANMSIIINACSATLWAFTPVRQMATSWMWDVVQVDGRAH